MKEVIELIISYISIWLPSIIAILGVATTVITAVNKMKDLRKAADNLKDNSLIKELTSKINVSIQENQELRYQNSLLLDQITKIKDYVETKKKEG